MDAFEIIEKEIELEPKERELKNIFKKDAKEGLDKISKYISEKYHFKTFSENDGNRDEIYIFQDGIYTRNGAFMTIKKLVKKILGEEHSSHYSTEIIEKVKINTAEIGLTKDEFATKDQNLICIKNGILNLETRELMPHSPEHPFLSKIPVDYNPAADCPQIKKLFEGIFYPEDIPVIQEWLGNCLLRNYKFKKALLLEAPMNAGKTQFLNVLHNFIGQDNISGVSLQNMYKDFSVASLFGKHINIVDDLSFRDVKETGKFKMATGDGVMSARNLYHDMFSFSNFSKLTFATNQIPKIDFDDDAYYFRWIIIRCPFTHGEKEEKTVPDIGNKISTPEELSGLLNYALEGLKRLEENRGFSYDSSLEEVKSIMQRSSSTVMAFIQDEIIEDSEGLIPKSVFFNAYKDYCREKGTWTMTINKVGREIGKNQTYIIDKPDGMIGGKHVRCWGNAKFVDPARLAKESNQSGEIIHNTTDTTLFQ
jgi:putative DNA primase/helicase